jgi:hypothetical protein
LVRNLKQNSGAPKTKEENAPYDLSMGVGRTFSSKSPPFGAGTTYFEALGRHDSQATFHMRTWMFIVWRPVLVIWWQETRSAFVHSFTLCTTLYPLTRQLVSTNSAQQIFITALGVPGRPQQHALQSRGRKSETGSLSFFFCFHILCALRLALQVLDVPCIRITAVWREWVGRVCP